MTPFCNIGIDPGASGGIAFIKPDEVLAFKMPETDRDILDLLREHCTPGNSFAWLEKVHSMPGQGVASSFKFGAGFGGLKMALAAVEIPYELVTPQKWMKALGCMTKGDKSITKQRAQQLFPQIKCTHAVSESLLIAYYGRGQHGALANYGRAA